MAEGCGYTSDQTVVRSGYCGSQFTDHARRWDWVHSVGNKVERTYRRTDYLEQRRVLMERWADHVAGGTSEVVQMVAQ